VQPSHILLGKTYLGSNLIIIKRRLPLTEMFCWERDTLLFCRSTFYNHYAMKMYLFYFEFVHERVDIFYGLLVHSQLAVNFWKVLELDQYAFLTAYGLLNTKHVKFNGKSQICFLEIVKSQRHFMVILTLVMFNLNSSWNGWCDSLLYKSEWNRFTSKKKCRAGLVSN